jgi:formylglycine-generating enzyme required for sulfatase activity
MLAPNTSLQNRYVIESLLGQGGMGTVYKAVDQRFGSVVALKQTLVDGEQLRRAFQREAQLLNGLRHAALPVVMDYFTEESEAFLVMQYIPGSDLAELLEQRGGPFPVERVMWWADQLLDALDYLHTHQPPVIHRDIKPQNLKLADRDQIVLLDFGLAKGSSEGSSESNPLESKTSSVLGYTPSYAPFEQIQGSGTGPRSDLYSLAATLYHLITGVTPVDALTRTGAVLNSQPDPLKPANELNPETPPAIAAVLTQAMALNREHRPANAKEMRNALREASFRPIRSDRETRLIEDAAGSAIKPDSQSGPLQMQAEMALPVARSSFEVSTVLTPVETSAGSGKSTGNAKRWIALVVILLIVAGAAAALVWKRSKTDVAPALPEQVNAPETTAPPPPAVAGIPLKSFAFDLVATDPRGVVTGRSRGEAKYFTEDLGRGVTLDMALIPGGNFLMGSPDTEKFRFGEEGPQRNVEVPAFYMGKFEVTQAQWQAVAALPKIKLDLNPSPSNFEGVDRPIQNVSWQEAAEFCARLSKKTGRKWRLPSEAEWEYACRAGTMTPFYYGENITSELSNYDGREPYASGPRGEFRKQTMPVGKTGFPNAFGLYDMHGNMWEWCLDPWHENYRAAPLDGSVWESGGDASQRIVRGGAWNRPANNCRSAYRLKVQPGKRYDVIGFRVVIAASEIPVAQ